MSADEKAVFLSDEDALLKGEPVVVVADRRMRPVPELPRAAREREGFEAMRRWVGTGVIMIVSMLLVLGPVRWWLGDAVLAPDTELTARLAKYAALVGWEEVDGRLDGSGVRVCIVDSGIDLSHPDLDHLTLAGWSDFVGQQQSPYDDQGHGTAMAGLLVAAGGLRGHARGVELLVAKALGENGSGNDQIVADAIDWCVAEKADIVSLSLGGAPGVIPGSLRGDSSEAAADAAIDVGVFVVAAAGNDGGPDDDGDVSSPGTLADVICVGGVDSEGNLWAGSSRGRNTLRLWPPPPTPPRTDPDKKPELVAPAALVPVLAGGAWGLASGTSVATVYVTASLALLLDGREDLQREGSAGGDRPAIGDVKEWLRTSVTPDEGQDQGGHDDSYGYGLLNVSSLLATAGVEGFS